MDSQVPGCALDGLRAFFYAPDVAADAFIEQWQGYIGDTVHRLLRARKAGHLCDEDDIRQCVLLSLVVAARRGHLHVETPQQFGALINKVAVNQVNAAIRAALADRRDSRRTRSLRVSSTYGIPDSELDPSEAAARNELRTAVLNCLDEAAQRIILKRGLGQTWEQIASEEPRRMSADAVRKVFRRSIRPLISRFLRADAG